MLIAVLFIQEAIKGLGGSEISSQTMEFLSWSWLGQRCLLVCRAKFRLEFPEGSLALFLVYLLKENSTALHAKSQMGMPSLEATFETLVNAFVFLDKNKDGYVSKSEMVDAINETTTGERLSGQIATKRLEEMDCDRNGMVNFKEFLFAFTRWVGIDDIEDDKEGKENV